jgi:hypothetical protein
VLESFKKHQLSWSGQLALSRAEKLKLREQGMAKRNPADFDNVRE